MTASQPALDRFDIVSPEARADIHRRYREMRAHGPLHRFTDPFSSSPAWVVLSHDGASEVLRDTTTFIRDASLLPGAKPRPPGPPGLEMITGDMVHRDPPEHTRLRRLVNRAFSSRVVDGLRSSVQSIVRELLDAVDERDDFDLIADFAFPLPVRLICEMLGLPASVLPRLEGWGTDVLADDLPRMLNAANGLRELIDPYIDAREAEATDDLLSHLVHARTVNGERLSRTELHSMSLLLFLAGHETTVNLLSNCVLAILSEDGVRERILADASACAATIEEVLRYDGPADLASVRYVSVDAELEGVPLAVGDRIFPSLLAANRDPAVFADPDRFDVDRDNRASLAFGAGVHSCVGSRLARMEVREALHALFDRRPGLTLAIDRSELPWKPSRMMHGVLALPVRGR